MIKSIVIAAFLLLILTTVCFGDQKGLLVFSADWCGPCQQLKPELESADVQGALKEFQYKYWKVNVDKQKEIARAYNVGSVPTSVIVAINSEGRAKVVDKKVGYLNKKQIVEWLKNNK